MISTLFHRALKVYTITPTCTATQREVSIVQWTNSKPKTPSIYQSGPTNQCGLLWEKALLMWQCISITTQQYWPFGRPW